MKANSPYIFELPSIGSLEIGFLCFSEFANFPFIPKRVFWSYYTPDSVIRGRHAHFETQMILFAVSGSIVVQTEDVFENKHSFILDNPRSGLYIPKLTWHTMKYSHNAVQLVLTSTNYDEKDYIRDYHEFKKL